MKFDDALERELVRVRRLTNLESRARAVRRALVLLGHMHGEFMNMRDELIVRLHDEYDWTDAATAAYFGLKSKQRTHQIRHKEKT